MTAQNNNSLQFVGYLNSTQTTLGKLPNELQKVHMARPYIADCPGGTAFSKITLAFQYVIDPNLLDMQTTIAIKIKYHNIFQMHTKSFSTIRSAEITINGSKPTVDSVEKIVRDFFGPKKSTDLFGQSSSPAYLSIIINRENFGSES